MEEARHRSGNGYRERSPSHSRPHETQERHPKSRRRPKNQNDGETKGLSDRIHSLRRLLEKATDMPADIRQEKERELQGYVADQQRRQASRERNAVTSRYHFVRFMERKKADRLLKKLEKSFDTVMMHTTSSTAQDITTDSQNSRIDGDAEVTMDGIDGHQNLSPAERLALQQEEYKRRLHEAKVDLNYTLYAPLDQKYISLYPSNSNGENTRGKKDNAKVEQGQDASTKDDAAGIFRNDSGQKPPLWYEVEKAMETDTLEALRDGKILKADKDEAQSLTFRSMAEPARGKRVPGIESDSAGEDEGSEDDFFER
jgi:rRNA-processing protein Efg1